ncbi:MAG: Rdx family protein [Anaerolineales bacterium]|nr:Rdx family protein [Anaerolineales bacterium]
MTADLLEQFDGQIEGIMLVPSSGGRFEVSVNGNLVYSKLETHRHAQPGEVADLVRKELQEGT